MKKENSDQTASCKLAYKHFTPKRSNKEKNTIYCGTFYLFTTLKV